MGAGPPRLLDAGAIQRLERAGHPVRHVPIDLEPGFWTEVRAATRLQQLIAEAIGTCRTEMPIVLSGNCNSSVGTVAGLAPSQPGVIWLDAHPDLETPETTTSGFYDGQALATLTGRCWRQMTRTVRGFRPIADDRVLLVGGRDASDAERSLLAASAIRWSKENELSRDRMVEALDRLRAHTDSVYLHVDLDVHGSESFRANSYASEGGPSPQAVLQLIDLVKARFDVRAASITAFDPECDADGRATAAALELLIALASQ
jgi:arginase